MFRLTCLQSYKTSAASLKREIEAIAPVKNLRLVTDLNGKSRGYAFVELEDENATKLVYSRMRGRSIDGVEIFLDVERGRTVKDWKPRRLGNTSQTPRANKLKKAVLRAQQAAAANERRAERRFGPGGDRGGRGGRGGGFGGGGFRRSDNNDRGDRNEGDRGRYDRDRERGGNGGGFDRRNERRDNDRRDDRDFDRRR